MMKFYNHFYGSRFLVQYSTFVFSGFPFYFSFSSFFCMALKTRSGVRGNS